MDKSEQKKEKKMRFSKPELDKLSKKQDEILAQLAFKMVHESGNGIPEKFIEKEEIEREDYDDFNAF
jgi:hypothetical protein